MEIIVVLLVISVVVNILIYKAAIRKVKQYDSLEEYTKSLSAKLDENIEKAQLMLENMREIDIRGSFESDDEVGVVFKELKQMIEQYNDEL